jgi:hypothetical protein
MMENYLDESLELTGGPSRRVIEEAEVIPDVEEESILKQAHRDIRSKSNTNSEKKIVNEYTVTGDEKL